MPIVDRTAELQILRSGRQTGKSDDEIKQSIQNFRAQATAQQQTPLPSATPRQEPQKEEGLLSRLKGRLQKTVKAFSPEEVKKQTFAESILQGTGQALGAAFDIGATAIGKTAKALAPKALEEKAKEVGLGILESDLGKKGLEAVSKGIDAYQEFKANNPRIAADLEAVVNIASILPIGKATQVGVKSLAPLARPVVRRQSLKAVEKIGEKIAPKLTRREVGAALTEGRVIRGRKSRIFGSKPDTIKISDDVRKAATTIEELIPKAKNLTDAELVPLIQNSRTDIAQRLSPVMKDVKVSNDIKEDMVSSWLKIKEDQAKGVGRKLPQRRFEGAQLEFEDILLDVADADNLDQVWQFRKDYDSLIPQNVKNATQNSSEALQFEKDMWLENRRILKNIMEEMTEGLDEEAARSFGQMSDLYKAELNIVNRADIVKKGRKSFLLKVGATAAGGALLGGLID